MSGRRSRIEHPPGSRYIRIDLWAKAALGDACAAACLSVLEFFDRLKSCAGEWLGKNAGDVQAMLAGVYGRDKVRAGVDLLIQKGWVNEMEETVFVGQLWSRRRDLRLCPAVINKFIRENYIKSDICDFQETGVSEFRNSEELIPVVKREAVKSFKAAAKKPIATHPTGIFCSLNDKEWEQVEELVHVHGHEEVKAIAQIAAASHANGKAYLSSVRSIIQKKENQKVSKSIDESWQVKKAEIEKSALRQAQEDQASCEAGKKLFESARRRKSS